MTTRFNNISFKGYDAAPLRNIYIEEFYGKPIETEMKTICRKEGIELRKINDRDKWTQDNKTVIEKGGKPFLVADMGASSSLVPFFKKKFGISGQQHWSYLTGGNTFIGKYPNGEKWLITGEKISEKEKQGVSEYYDIPEKNIYSILKPDFHIDLGIRPVGYPNVLVNDPELALKKLEELDDGSKEFKALKATFLDYKEDDTYNYATADSICNSLKNIGFNPIRVAGVFYDGINFMNAVVNKHPDGTMSYITNSGECKNPVCTKLQKEFEKELREKVPQMRDVYFVKGKNSSPNKNYVYNSLKFEFGGIHCMTMEEPDFERWA